KFSYAHPAEAIDILELGEGRRLSLFQRKNIRRGADRKRVVFRLEEEIDLLCPQPLDVEGIARDEVLEMLDGLRPAEEAAGAARHRIEPARLLVALAHGMALADRADFGKLIARRIG